MITPEQAATLKKLIEMRIDVLIEYAEELSDDQAQERELIAFIDSLTDKPVVSR